MASRLIDQRLVTKRLRERHQLERIRPASMLQRIRAPNAPTVGELCRQDGQRTQASFRGGIWLGSDRCSLEEWVSARTSESRVHLPRPPMTSTDGFRAGSSAAAMIQSQSKNSEDRLAELGYKLREEWKVQKCCPKLKEMEQTSSIVDVRKEGTLAPERQGSQRGHGPF